MRNLRLVGTLVLLCVDQVAQVIALGPGDGQGLLQIGGWQFGAARQDPEGFAAGSADHGPAVVGIQADDPVIALEGAHETDFQLGVAAALHHGGVAAGHVDIAVLAAAAVGDGDRAIRLAGVFGRGVGHAAALEEHGQTRDFVPAADVAFKIDVFDRLHGWRGLQRGGGQQGEGQDEGAHGFSPTKSPSRAYWASRAGRGFFSAALYCAT